MGESSRKKYLKVFGSIDSLNEQTSWTLGIFNMLESLAWDTRLVLGVSKTSLIKEVISWCDETEMRDLSSEDKYKKVANRLSTWMAEAEGQEKHDKIIKGYCSPREILRRGRYFSEDYLNKEFDIFMNLCSTDYLNKLYRQYLPLTSKGTWFTHGNNGIYANSVSEKGMQMDNLAYNEEEGVLVANELKLGGNKNKDQILKYCYMYKVLEEKKFIKPNTKFLLLFIEDTNKNLNFENEIMQEINYVTKNSKSPHLLEDPILEIANNIIIKSLAWLELHQFNIDYMDSNDSLCEVEKKLIVGFNTSLNEKYYKLD